MQEKYCFIEILGVTNYCEGCQLCKNHFHPNDIKISKNGSEYLQRNALPKSTSRDTSAGIPGDCTWRCMDRDLMCHRVALAAHSQFLREMLKETDPDPDTARDHDNHNQTCDIYLSL